MAAACSSSIHRGRASTGMVPCPARDVGSLGRMLQKDRCMGPKHRRGGALLWLQYAQRTRLSAQYVVIAYVSGYLRGKEVHMHLTKHHVDDALTIRKPTEGLQCIEYVLDDGSVIDAYYFAAYVPSNDTAPRSSCHTLARQLRA
jgi:hypothetical protein